MRMNCAFILAIVATAAALPSKRKEEKPTYYSDDDEDISETELGGHSKKNEPSNEDDLVYPNEDYDSSEADSDRNVAAPKLSKQSSQVTEIKAVKPQAGNRMKFGRYGHLREPNKQRLQVTVIKTLKPIPTANKADVEPMDSDETYIDETVEMPEADYDSHVAPRSGKHLSQEENQMPKAQRTSNNFDLGLPPQQTDEKSREQLSRAYIDETVEMSEADYDSHAAEYDSGEHLPPPSLAEMHRVLGLPPPEHKQFACGQPLFLFAAVILLAVALELYRCCSARAAYQVNNIALRRDEKCRTTEGVQSEIRYEPLVENKV